MADFTPTFELTGGGYIKAPDARPVEGPMRLRFETTGGLPHSCVGGPAFWLGAHQLQGYPRRSANHAGRWPKPRGAGQDDSPVL